MSSEVFTIDLNQMSCATAIKKLDEFRYFLIKKDYTDKILAKIDGIEFKITDIKKNCFIFEMKFSGLKNLGGIISTEGGETSVLFNSREYKNQGNKDDFDEFVNLDDDFFQCFINDEVIFTGNQKNYIPPFTNLPKLFNTIIKCLGLRKLSID